ncbi:MAG: hypothetical protein WCK93_13260 [Nitrosomonadales bacterium]
MKGKRGHFCHLCQAILPNERFSGKGHARHVCTDCSRMPKGERDAIEQADEISGFMNQSHISDKNVARLKVLVSSTDAHISDLADIVLQIAELKPHKKRRMQILAEKRPDLLQRVYDMGLAPSHYSWDEVL